MVDNKNKGGEMIIEILRDWDMSNNFESDWFQVVQNQFQFENKSKKAKSLQISWDSVTGQIDGAIDILISNDVDYQTLVKTINIKENTNIEDCLMIILFNDFQFIKIRYKKNNITSGKLCAFLSYND